jgi:hypothetical protein
MDYDYISIGVPDMNDSVSRIVLDGKVYNIRFTYNDTADIWKWSMYDDVMNPIVLGVKIVPNFPINLAVLTRDLPQGAFQAYKAISDRADDHIGRSDFVLGLAEFMYVPLAQPMA